MDWNDPAARARLIEQVGPAEYARQQAANRAAIVIETVAGHALRPVSSRFGRLIAVGDTGNAYRDIADARRYAEANPALTPATAAMIQSGL